MNSDLFKAEVVKDTNIEVERNLHIEALGSKE